MKRKDIDTAIIIKSKRKERGSKDIFLNSHTITNSGAQRNERAVLELQFLLIRGGRMK